MSLIKEFQFIEIAAIFHFSLLGTCREQGHKLTNMEAIELQDVSDLHGFIANRRILDILRFIEANPNEKVKIFDGESAIAFTLKFGDFEIYEILVAHGFKLAIGKDYGEILSDLDERTSSIMHGVAQPSFD
jgi:hypothetical protein